LPFNPDSWYNITIMTATLRKAFTKASHLPQAAQQQLAEQLIEDIEGEFKWDRTLAHSQPLLEKLAAKARRARRAGKTRSKGFDEL
jgi:hypothetical protein